MRKLIQSFFLLLAAATDRELARMVEYLKAENRILRGKLPARVPVMPQERGRLVRLGRQLGPKIRDLITIVSPRTFLRWVNGETKPRRRGRKSGRKPTPDEVRELVLRLARETGWGYTRILGELKKLGVWKISRSTVVNILKQHGLDPGPQRGEGTWADFLRRHAQTLYACDFFSAKVWTGKGLVDVFVLFFLHVGSRRVYLGGMTTNPDGEWMKQRARNVALHFAEQGEKPTILLHDYDTKFTQEFDGILKSEGIAVKKVGPRAPNLVAHAERWVQSVRQEALDHFVVLGEAHLRPILTSYVDWYNTRRPHQALGNEPLGGLPPVDCEPGTIALAEVRCEGRLGGLLKHYFRQAA